MAWALQEGSVEAKVVTRGSLEILHVTYVLENGEETETRRMRTVSGSTARREVMAHIAAESRRLNAAISAAAEDVADTVRGIVPSDLRG